MIRSNRPHTAHPLRLSTNRSNSPENPRLKRPSSQPCGSSAIPSSHKAYSIPKRVSTPGVMLPDFINLDEYLQNEKLQIPIKSRPTSSKNEKNDHSRAHIVPPIAKLAQTTNQSVAEALITSQLRDSGAKSINHHGRQPITTHETQPVYRISGPLSKNDVYRLQAPTTENISLSTIQALSKPILGLKLRPLMSTEVSNQVLTKALSMATSGQIRKAISAFSKAISGGVSGGNFVAHYNRGCLFHTLGQYERAVNDFNHCIAFRPTSLDALINKSVSLFSLNRFDEAEESLTTAIDFYPRSIDCILYRGHIRRRKGDYSKAQEDYTTARLLDPSMQTKRSSSSKRAFAKTKAIENIQSKKESTLSFVTPGEHMNSKANTGFFNVVKEALSSHRTNAAESQEKDKLNTDNQVQEKKTKVKMRHWSKLTSTAAKERDDVLFPPLLTDAIQMENVVAMQDHVAISTESSHKLNSDHRHWSWAINTLNKKPSQRIALEISRLYSMFSHLEFFSEFLFNESTLINKVFQYGRHIRLCKGANIVRQGDSIDEDSGFYILLSGSCAILLHKGDPRFEEQINVLSEGKSFGEIAFLRRDSIRGATVITASQCDLLVLSRGFYEKFLRPKQEKDIRELMLFMHNTHIFEELDQETKTKTANMNYQDALTVASMLVEVKRYSRGQIIFSQDTATTTLYIVKRGTITLCRDIFVPETIFKKLCISFHQTEPIEKLVSDHLLNTKEETLDKLKGWDTTSVSPKAKPSPQVFTFDDYNLRKSSQDNQSSATIASNGTPLSIVKTVEAAVRMSMQTRSNRSSTRGSVIRSSMTQNQHGQRGRIVSVEIATIQPYGIFGENTFTESQSSVHSYSAICDSLCECVLLNRRQFASLILGNPAIIGTLRSKGAKIPSDDELLRSISASNRFEKFKEKVLSEVLAEQQAKRMLKHSQSWA